MEKYSEQMQQHTRVMETETIQKNGASPKSQRVGFNFFNRMFCLLLVAGLAGAVFSSCSEEGQQEIAVTDISLDKTTLTLTVGNDYTLKAMVLPKEATNKEITWTSSNQTVATVDDKGVVTALAKGTTTIIAIAGDKTATCALTVAAATVDVSDISLDKTSLPLVVGADETLVATVLPANATDKTVTWTSSATGIATVSNGAVTAVAEGTATITAKAGDKTATCTVTVTVAVSDISLDKTTLTLIVGDTETLTATVVPDNATDKTITWTSSATGIATVSNGAVTAVAEGTATITAKAGDKTATCAVTISSIPESVVINGVRWATRNVDAPGTFTKNPEDAGMFYQWNRKLGWSSTDPMVNSNGGKVWNSSYTSAATWEKVNDPSPAGYRIPNEYQLNTLLNKDKVVSEWTTIKGVNGYKFTDKVSGAFVFLPALGFRSSNGGSLQVDGTDGYYWSSSVMYIMGHTFYQSLWFHDGNMIVAGSDNRYFGRSIRCVAE
jgi:uncharacterized protein (TIGR02145 family)